MRLIKYNDNLPSSKSHVFLFIHILPETNWLANTVDTWYICVCVCMDECWNRHWQYRKQQDRAWMRDKLVIVHIRRLLMYILCFMSEQCTWSDCWHFVLCYQNSALILGTLWLWGYAPCIWYGLRKHCSSYIYNSGNWLWWPR